MKEITKEQVKLLMDKKIIKNGINGITDGDNRPIGFYRTRNKRYIEDRYVSIAKQYS